ncbi:MAG: EF-hand domain-containing protein [Paracoccaceae bacterium]
MKRLVMMLAPLTLATAAFAADMPVVEDADGSGAWSLAELQTAWPDMTPDGFLALDTNADGSVDATELKTAWDNGVLAPTGG